MPSLTDRQAALKALQEAYLANMSAESDAMLVDSDTSSSSWSSNTSSSSEEAIQPSMGELLIDSMGDLYSQHYLNERRTIIKTSDNMTLLFTEYKTNRPKIFYSYMRVKPSCFDAILSHIHDDPVFHNDSQNEQHPIQEQLAIALYRFGHYGNAANTLKVALWAGVGYGTVNHITKRVMTAVCRISFRRASLHWPDDKVKEEAKVWVEENLCPS